jgi:hypothetical protein
MEKKAACFHPGFPGLGGKKKHKRKRKTHASSVRGRKSINKVLCLSSRFVKKFDESNATLLPGKSSCRIFHVPQFAFFFSLRIFVR